MRIIIESELLLINGGLNYFGTTVTVENPNIPQPVFADIENTLTQAINGNWDCAYAMVYLCADGRMPYYVSYKAALWDALVDAGYINF